MFAGPYDFNELSHLVKGKAKKDDKSFITSAISFIAKRIGQAYLNTLNWKDNEKFNVLSIVDYVNENFPSTFITDGRTISFEDHAKTLEHNLLEHTVNVTSVYYDFDLMHEYQFNLGTISEDNITYALETFELLIEYLNN